MQAPLKVSTGIANAKVDMLPKIPQRKSRAVSIMLEEMGHDIQTSASTYHGKNSLRELPENGLWQQNQDSSIFKARPLITERPAVSAESPVTQSDGSPKKFPAASSVSAER